MHPDLVSAPSLRDRADDAETISCRAACETFLYYEMSASQRAPRMDRLLEPDWRWRVNALPDERRIHRFRLPFRPAPHDREIFFSDPLFLHHQTEAPSGVGVFRHEHKAARFAVKPVHDRDLSAVRDFEGEEMFQFAPKCAHRARFGGMDQQEWRLVDYEEIFPLRDDRDVVCGVRLAGG